MLQISGFWHGFRKRLVHKKTQAIITQVFDKTSGFGPNVHPIHTSNTINVNILRPLKPKSCTSPSSALVSLPIASFYQLHTLCTNPRTIPPAHNRNEIVAIFNTICRKIWMNASHKAHMSKHSVCFVWEITFTSYAPKFHSHCVCKSRLLLERK